MYLYHKEGTCDLTDPDFGPQDGNFKEKNSLLESSGLQHASFLPLQSVE